MRPKRFIIKGYTADGDTELAGESDDPGQALALVREIAEGGYFFIRDGVAVNCVRVEAWDTHQSEPRLLGLLDKEEEEQREREKQRLLGR